MCVEDEDSIGDMLNEELNIDNDDEMNLENERESVSEESCSEVSESESESEKSVVCIDRWKDMIMDDKKPKAYTFIKKARPQFKSWMIHVGK
jgi:hypothetical protein